MTSHADSPTQTPCKSGRGHDLDEVFGTRRVYAAGDEAALYVAEAADRTRARDEMIEVLDQLIEGVTA